MPGAKDDATGAVTPLSTTVCWVTAAAYNHRRWKLKPKSERHQPPACGRTMAQRRAKQPLRVQSQACALIAPDDAVKEPGREIRLIFKRRAPSDDDSLALLRNQLTQQ